MEKTIHSTKNTLSFSFLGENFHVLRADMENLWEEMVLDTKEILTNSSTNTQETLFTFANPKYENEERLPYWAELWPSSLALAKWLFMNTKKIKRKNCLDLGCGLGFTAICGAWRGASVTAVDYEERAILLAKENAFANQALFKSKKLHIALHIYLQNRYKTKETCKNICKRIALKKKHKISTFFSKTNPCPSLPQNLHFQVMDWRFPHVAPKSFDFIWAADIIYERSFALPVLTFLDYALSEHGCIWIAEPGRTIFENFQSLIAQKNTKKNTQSQKLTSAFLMEKVYFEKTHSLSSKVPSANVSIWEIRRSS